MPVVIEVRVRARCFPPCECDMEGARAKIILQVNISRNSGKPSIYTNGTEVVYYVLGLCYVGGNVRVGRDHDRHGNPVASTYAGRSKRPPRAIEQRPGFAYALGLGGGAGR